MELIFYGGLVTEQNLLYLNPVKPYTSLLEIMIVLLVTDGGCMWNRILVVKVGYISVDTLNLC